MTVHHRGHEDVDEGARLGAGELLLADADDLICVIAHVDGASDDARIAREAAGPVIERDHGVGFAAGSAVVVRREQTA